MARVKCLVLAGCTGAGKSRLAMRIAERRSAEIVSADSVAVYRGLDIGSAKPTRLCRQHVPHHLIDVANPELSLTSPYTAGDFARDARGTIHAVAGRGNVPVVCGGSGMYLNFLMHGHDQSAGACTRPDSITTDAVDHALTSLSWDDAVNDIAERLSLDPVPLRRVQHGNRRRLLRTAHRLLTPSDSTATLLPSDIDFRAFALVRPRLALYRRIDLRCEHMIQRGLLDEVVGLHSAGRLPRGSPPALSVGYRQALAYLDDAQPGQFDLGGFRHLLDEFQAASRQLARRQLTWFRNDAAFRFIDVGGDDEDDALLDRVLNEFDLDRSEYDAATVTDGFADEQQRLRQLSEEDRRQQRLYVPQPVIFQYGLGEELIMKLLAQDLSCVHAV